MEHSYLIERRLSLRKPLNLPAAIQYLYLNDIQTRTGTTRNLHREGAYLDIGSVPRLIGSVIRFYLGPTVDPVSFNALVLHQSDAGLGLTFMDYSPQTSARLDALLAQAA